jgi:ABC-type antimicrobial peptide transport system permease subunit
MFKLCLTFLKSKVFRIAASSFMIAVIMVILALSQTIITFDSGKIIKDEMDKMDQSSLFMEKFQSEEERQNTYKYYVEVPESDIQAFKDAGYNGGIYEVLNITLPLNTAVNSAGWQNQIFNNSLYINETLGTMIIDEAYLTSKFGNIEYVARLDEFHPCGVFITDYVADAIMFYKSKDNLKSYEDILGEYLYVKSNLNLDRGYINGIIKTNYKKEYEGLIKEFQENKYTNSTDFMEDELFQKFSSEIYSTLGFSYTLNSNYKCDFVNYDIYQTIWTYGLKINDIVYNTYSGPQVWNAKTKGYVLNDNEIKMNYQKYNEIFGTEYNLSNLDTFVPHKIKLEQYKYYDYENKNPLISLEVTISSLHPGGSYTLIASDNVYDAFKQNLLYTKGLYFDGNENLDKVIDIANELNFEQKLFVIEGIHTMTKAVDVFIPIFELVAIVLCAGIVFIMISFSTKMVKDKMHDIGILKALGCKNNTIGIVFGLQLLLIAICTIILSTIGYFFFIDLANDVLIESLKVLAPSHIVLDLDFLTFKIDIVGINSLLVIILTIISFVIPMLKIYRIKPVKIIKTKE